MSLRTAIQGIGTQALGLLRDIGGISLLAAYTLRALVPPRIDWRELVRHIYHMGYRSAPIIALTAFAVAGIMVVQSAYFVDKYGADSLVGWATAYTVFREIGPVFIGIMFAGRIATSTTAELGTMVATEQVDTLRSLAIEPVNFLAVPRVLAMTVALSLLFVVGASVTLAGGMLFAKLLLDIEYATFYVSVIDGASPLADFVQGLLKSFTFGFAIGVTSCYYGFSVRRSAADIGRAVNASVAAAAIAIVSLDFLVTKLF